MTIFVRKWYFLSQNAYFCANVTSFESKGLVLGQSDIFVKVWLFFFQNDNFCVKMAIFVPKWQFLRQNENLCAKKLPLTQIKLKECFCVENISESKKKFFIQWPIFCYWINPL